MTAPTAARTTSDDPIRVETVPPRPTWLPTLVGLAALITAVDVAYMALVAPIPAEMVIGTLTVIGAALAVARPKPGAIMLLAVSVLGVVGGAPFAIPGLTHPDATLDFVHAVTTFPLRIVLAGVAVLTLRRAGGPAIEVMVGSVGVAVAAVVASLLVPGPDVTTIDPAEADAVVGAQDFLWDTDELSVATGGVVAVDNADLARHNFSVEGTDISVEVPASTSVAVAVDLPAGEYTYFCDITGHEDMTGTLIVG